LDSVLQVVDRLDPGHANRVARLAYELSMSYGLGENESSMISQASRYHDIGKIAVPKKLLQKPGLPRETEMNQIRKHVLYGLKVIAHLTGKEAAIAKTIIATHHEHWDGNGYPRGLKGKEIPLSGRIVAICDVYDALTKDRPYRAAWPREKAIAYIRERSGTQFDPALVEPFLRIVMQPAGDSR
jgi:putative two-component system response regulator